MKQTQLYDFELLMRDGYDHSPKYNVTLVASNVAEAIEKAIKLSLPDENRSGNGVYDANNRPYGEWEVKVMTVKERFN